MKADDLLKKFLTLTKDEQRIFLNRAVLQFGNKGCVECPFVDICENAQTLVKSPCFNCLSF
ncbi:MAG: hypothetical protein LIO87_05140 [Eubacterium sp.]|nr:hypothetical protein [Eubacterium sp.]